MDYVPAGHMVYFREQKTKDLFCGADIVVYKWTVSFSMVLGLFKFISK